MLKPEDAQKTLTKARPARWEESLAAAIGKLPKDLRSPGFAIMGRDSKGNPREGNEGRAAAAKQLDSFKRKARLQLFDVLFPGVGVHVEGGWRLARRLPYQSGYDRKAFRAVGKPGLTRAARMDWLVNLLAEIGGYEGDAAWFATWAGHLAGGFGAPELGILLAAAIDSGGAEGEKVFDILCASARGEHDIGRLSRPVIRALLLAARPGGWEVIENVLVDPKAVRHREAILECIDEAHPEAFRRMLGTLVEHDLAKHRDVVQALDVWFDFHWDAVSVGLVNRVLGQVLVFLDEKRARKMGVASEDAETAYLALWALAFDDATAAVEPAAKLLKDTNVERRFVGVHLLGQLELPAARKWLVKALADDDLRVALHALETCRASDEADTSSSKSVGLFKRLEKLLERIPEVKTHLEPIVWPWHVLTADRQLVLGEMVAQLGDRSATRLLPHVDALTPLQRDHVLTRVLELKNDDVVDCVVWLVHNSEEQPRLTGLRLLARLQESGRAAKSCRQMAKLYQKLHPDPTSAEEALLEALGVSASTKAT